jgi:hypothetical protein
MKRRFAPLWLLLPATVIVFFHRLTLSNRILARGDIYLYFYPYWQAAASALRDGRLPLWNPYLFMGAPLIANSQVGFFYPLNWPLWLFLPIPAAATATIALHLIIAASGSYVLARRALNLLPDAAVVVALLFGLGGYLTAQVEHLNQLQALAWLPWALVVLGTPSDWSTGRSFARRLALLSAFLALQLAAGHSQTVFITGMALFLWWCGAALAQRNNWRQPLSSLGGLVVASGLAASMVAVQLAPTLELASLSSRHGGLPLNEALSFSLHPLVVGRSLLPGYGETLFTEYVSFLPLTALLLAVAALWRWRQDPMLWPPTLLLVVGFAFALGQFNPIYIGLAYLPGFNLFRAPGRWLALYALGASLLAGVGWQQWHTGRSVSSLALRGALIAVTLMIGWGLLAPLLARHIPTATEAPARVPSWLTVFGWVAELAAAAFLLRRDSGRRWRTAAVVTLLLAVLYLSGRALPHHQLATAPQAYSSLRPPVSWLQDRSSCGAAHECPLPGGRVLSLSDIFFDLGDAAELQIAYSEYLNDEAFAQLLVAHKQKEVLDPNLPLAYGIPSVDGFDGGILPLQAYVELTSLLLPAGSVTTDGRLREFLDGVPEDRWLDLLQVQYLITDKTADVWRDEVFFDRQHPLDLPGGAKQEVGYLPSYEATAVWLLASGPGEVIVTADDDVWSLTAQQIDDDLWAAVLPAPAIPDAIVLRAASGPWLVEGLALVDDRDGTFQPLVPGAYRLVHSGDVKIYENLDVMPRAFLVYRWQWQDDLAAAVATMSAPSFSPRDEAVLLGTGLPANHQETPGTATIRAYGDDLVIAVVDTAQLALLVLTDAAYPGWTATLDGRPVPIHQADGLFRGVMVPPGESEVVFRFAPASLRLGARLSVAGTLLWLSLVTAGTVRRAPREDTPKG